MVGFPTMNGLNANPAVRGAVGGAGQLFAALCMTDACMGSLRDCPLMALQHCCRINDGTDPCNGSKKA